MNMRQQKYKKNIISGMNKYNAAIAAGYSINTAKSRTKDLDARVGIADVMERLGLTDKALINKLIELLGATRVIGYLHNYKKSDKVGNGKLEKIDPDEVISNEFLDVPDNQVRAKALEIALKLKGQLRDKVDHNVAIQHIQMTTINIEQKPMELNFGDEYRASRNTKNA